MLSTEGRGCCQSRDVSGVCDSEAFPGADAHFSTLCRSFFFFFFFFFVNSTYSRLIVAWSDTGNTVDVWILIHYVT